jgi:hypothetical protein
MNSVPLSIRPVESRSDRKAFVDLAWEVYKGDPYWVPPLKDEVHGLLDPKKNPWFGHGRAALWLATRAGRTVGRISAQVDELVQEHMAPGTGQWECSKRLTARPPLRSSPPPRSGFENRA